jgi:acyl-CoA thioesterase
LELQDRIARDGRVLERLNISVDGSGSAGVRLKMKVAEDMVNAGGYCHGGMLFALADTACAYALAEAGSGPVTLDAGITYLRPATAGDLVAAVPEVVRAGRRIGHCEVRLTREDGQPHARRLAAGNYVEIRSVKRD